VDEIGCVAHKELEMHSTFLLEALKGRDHLGINGREPLKYSAFSGRGNGTCSIQWVKRFSVTTVLFPTSKSAGVR
jgi:hypothetical protein